MAYDPSQLKYADSVLPSLTVQEAEQLQFKLVEKMSDQFSGDEFLSMGDLGVAPKYKKPEQTEKVERTLASFFGTESAALVRGAGTGAIRTILSTLLAPGDSMFIHTAPVYTTTKDTIRLLGLETKAIDCNDLAAVEKAVSQDETCKVFYIQHARQQPTDTYDLKSVIHTVKRSRPDLPVVVDDNYCVMKTHGIGVEYGADYSTFSGFKVLGPEGIGVITGKEKEMKLLQRRNYSGGGQVQGYEAMELLRMMTFAPVSLATQNEQVEEVCRQLNEGAINRIENAYMANAQSKNVIVELLDPNAPEVIKLSNAYGAATHPVGAESKYEMIPMIYHVSGSFIEAQPSLKVYGLRINPMKSGASTVLKILDKAINAAAKQ
ncbi:Cys/Met metabolism PLP-dependent enzyme [Lentibacillus halodurans]|uniref:Cys/Met metabolism PLP-dependent enzyme n=1 Tax=Lentibacillus halodurans TaxID=237679 RepID=A0A1I0YI71_9BACI|nr:aminotransferase class V-fold PLP-dependent enzyme [Lentibacillus halodurans]SFB12456.1 Cys/Met metabolism PLP-dependent enzyme [Lentibacillus halodurans]